MNADNPPDEPDISDAPWTTDPSRRGNVNRGAMYDEPEVLDEDGLPVAEGTTRDEEPRKRRRRRRGGRGRKRGERSERNPSESRTNSQDSTSLDDEDPLNLDVDVTAESSAFTPEFSDAVADEDLEQDSEIHSGHRAVPSWDEAVGILVSANLEARERSPESRGQHRGRGRGRGGRGRRDSR